MPTGTISLNAVPFHRRRRNAFGNRFITILSPFNSMHLSRQWLSTSQTLGSVIWFCRHVWLQFKYLKRAMHPTFPDLQICQGPPPDSPLIENETFIIQYHDSSEMALPLPFSIASCSYPVLSREYPYSPHCFFTMLNNKSYGNTLYEPFHGCFLSKTSCMINKTAKKCKYHG